MELTGARSIEGLDHETSTVAYRGWGAIGGKPVDLVGTTLWATGRWIHATSLAGACDNKWRDANEAPRWGASSHCGELVLSPVR